MNDIFETLAINSQERELLRMALAQELVECAKKHEYTHQLLDNCYHKTEKAEWELTVEEQKMLSSVAEKKKQRFRALSLRNDWNKEALSISHLYGGIADKLEKNL